MFASAVRDTVKLEGGNSVIIRKLSKRTLIKASEIRESEARANSKQLGAELVKLYQDMSAEQVAAYEKEQAEKKQAKEPTREERDRARYNSYDRFTILNAGIVSWDDARPVNADNIDDLDQDSADALYKAIVDLSDPDKDVAAVAPKVD